MAAIMELDRIDAIPPAIQVPTKDEISQAPPTHETQPEIDDGSSASPVTPRRSKTQLTVIMSMLFVILILSEHSCPSNEFPVLYLPCRH